MPGEIDLRSEIDPGFGGIDQGNAAGSATMSNCEYGVVAFGVTRNDGLERKRLVIFHHPICARAAPPAQVIGVLIGESAFASNVVLRLGGEKPSLVPQENVRADDAVVGTGAEREVAAGDAGAVQEFGPLCQREFIRVARGEFDSGGGVPIDVAIGRVLFDQAHVPQQADVADSPQAAGDGLKNGDGVPGQDHLELAINHRQFEPQADSIVEVVAQERLGGDAGEVLPVRWERLMRKGVGRRGLSLIEISDLLGKAGDESRTESELRWNKWGIGAKIQREERLRAEDGESCANENFHLVP